DLSQRSLRLPARVGARTCAAAGVSEFAQSSSTRPSASAEAPTAGIRASRSRAAVARCPQQGAVATDNSDQANDDDETVELGAPNGARARCHAGPYAPD